MRPSPMKPSILPRLRMRAGDHCSLTDIKRGTGFPLRSLHGKIKLQESPIGSAHLHGAYDQDSSFLRLPTRVFVGRPHRSSQCGPGGAGIPRDLRHFEYPLQSSTVDRRRSSEERRLYRLANKCFSSETVDTPGSMAVQQRPHLIVFLSLVHKIETNTLSYQVASRRLGEV
jgi:hypothetical protein